MNQEKIGKFIAKCRKDKKMTQSELAEKLGVTDNLVAMSVLPIKIPNSRHQ